jgi:hypothetical protein
MTPNYGSNFLHTTEYGPSSQALTKDAVPGKWPTNPLAHQAKMDFSNSTTHSQLALDVSLTPESARAGSH